MQETHFLEKLALKSPGMEIWWDASPLVFHTWKKGVLSGFEPPERLVVEGQINRLMDLKRIPTSLVRGVTTNPVLSYDVVKDDEEQWREKGRLIALKNPGIDQETLFWKLYKASVKMGSDILLPLFEATSYKEGYLSAQVDPRSPFDKDKMLTQALDLATINDNVMIKVPGTREGLAVIEILTEKGIPTNMTLSFVLPQLMDCAETVKKAVAVARKNGVDLSKWRSVITQMESRFSSLGDLVAKGAAVGVDVTEEDQRWAELAIFKKTYALLTDGGYESKLLSCSIRFGPEVDGEMKLMHLTEKTGAGVILTCPPNFIGQLIRFQEEHPITLENDAIRKPVPEDVMEKLLRIPYFERACRVDGYTRDEYNTHPAVVKTAEQFAEATKNMVAFAGECL